MNDHIYTPEELEEMQAAAEASADIDYEDFHEIDLDITDARDNRRSGGYLERLERRLGVIYPSDWQGTTAPDRPMLIPGLIPRRQVTMLSGDGGVGKSLLAYQLGLAGALDVSTLGMDIEASRVVYVGAEDEADEFQRRSEGILRTLGKQHQHLKGYFQLIPLSGQDATLAEPDDKGKMFRTELMLDLEDICYEVKPNFIILDTSADLFGGNEIDRRHVRQFVGMLRKLANDCDAAVVLLSHPSQTGMMTGAGTSGSTAWNNSVRSRLYLTRPQGDNVDPDIRVLRTMKANYGTIGGETLLRWKDDSFVLADRKEIEKPVPVMVQAAAERVFIECLALINERDDYVNDGKTGNYAPRVIADMAEAAAAGINVKHLEAAMKSLLKDKKIALEKFGAASRNKKKFVITE